MSMDRLPSSGTRNTYVDQVNERTGNPINEQDQNHTTQPIMRQRETGREDDEDEKDQANSSSLLTQHSKPQLTSRSGANQASLQLESKDEEKFVYTKKHFKEAIEKEDVVTLVRMLRHGIQSRQDYLTNGNVVSIAEMLINARKSAILAELIREDSTFSTSSCTILGDDSSIGLASAGDFVKEIDNHRALSQDFKKKLLSSWLINAARSGDPDRIKMAIQLESSFLSDEGHDGYRQALECALIQKNNLHELIIEKMFVNKSQLKIGINSKACSFAAGLAAAISRPDWAIRLQDESLKIEKSCDENEPSFFRSLAHIISSENKNNFMEDLLIFLMSKNTPNKSGFNTVDTEVFRLYEANSENSRSTAFYRVSNELIKEGIRPDVAEVISEIYLTCWDALLGEPKAGSDESTDQDSSDDISEIPTEDSDDYADRIPDQKKLQSLLATQLNSLVIESDQAEQGAVHQVAALKKIGEDFTKNLLGDIPKLVENCFDSVNAELTLNADQLQKSLIDNLCFPKSLAEFLAEAMSLMVSSWATKPGMVLPRPMSALEINEYVRSTIKENACQEFKNNFSELIKQQKLITLFNEDAKGREDLWHSYFYVYLDLMREALPSPKKEH